jgi:Peptidase family M28
MQSGSAVTGDYPTAPVALLDQTELRERVAALAAIERPSASSGEARAAELIAAELGDRGARVEVEHEPAHGTYYWPVGLLCGAAAIVGARARRLPAVVVGLAGAAALVDDTSGGRLWFRRRFLPTRTTTNVVAEMGAPDAERTVVFMAHHDAANAGLVFDDRGSRALLRRFPGLVERIESTPPLMWGAVAGPALVALGAALGLRRLRLLATLLSAGYAAAMADIGLRPVVPGANDNLSAVAVLLSLARSLEDDPVPGVRVILLSTGSEESFLEGMQAYARRHFEELERDSTTFVCLETVGSPHLATLAGEGMMWMNDYPEDLRAEAAEAAAEVDVDLRRGPRLRFATDGLVSLRAGYPTVAFVSYDDLKLPPNYHQMSDTAANVDYSTVADCARVCRRFLDRRAA